MTPAKEIDGELWVKASDMNLAVAEAVKAEREECAKVCDELAAQSDIGEAWIEDCAAAIRSRNA